ncbi:hypothetical protein LCGC14_3005720, partial [marine sediment metagenome]
ITHSSGIYRPFEMCLSLPGRVFQVLRHKKITVKGQDLTGQVLTRRLHGRDAQMVSHEVGHLSGILLEDIAIGEYPAYIDTASDS